MTSFAGNELIILRHAPADHGGRLCGRTDVAACLPDDETLAALRARLRGLSVVASPARRCRDTARALFKDTDIQEDSRLWEQDFGIDEGRAFADLPDLGSLSLAELAQYSAPDGESFLEMSLRVRPALSHYAQKAQQGETVLLVAHAGTARAALGLALGHPELGLKFEIAPLSLTRLRCLENAFSIVAVNEMIIS